MGVVVETVITQVAPIVTAVAALLGVVLSRSARSEAKQANDAVNHREDGEPKLIDLAVQLSADMATVKRQLSDHIIFHEVEQVPTKDDVILLLRERESE